MGAAASISDDEKPSLTLEECKELIGEGWDAACEAKFTEIQKDDKVLLLNWHFHIQY